MAEKVPLYGCPGLACLQLNSRDFRINKTESQSQFEGYTNFLIDKNCLINLWQDLFCIITKDGNFLTFSEAWENFLGYSLNEISGKTFIEFVHPEDRDQTTHHLKELNKSKKLACILNRFRCKDGSYKWLEWRASVSEDKSLVFAFAREVTQNKILEDDIRIKTHNLNERLKELNCLNKATKLFQDLTQSEETVIPILVNIITEAYQYPEITVSRITLNNKQYFSKHFRESKWKQSGDIEVSGKVTGKLEVFCLRDQLLETEDPFLNEEMTLLESITKLLGQFIERSANYHQALFLASVVDTSGSGIATANFEGTVLFWNKGAEKIYGIKESEIVGNSIFPFIPENRQKDFSYFISETKQGRKITDYETERRRPDGSTVFVSMNVSPLKNSKGIIDSFLVIVQDITERKKEEERIHQNEALFRLYAENMTDVIWTLDVTGKFLYVSPSVERLRGYTSEEAERLTISESLTPDSAEIAIRTLQEFTPRVMAGEYVEPQTHYLEQKCKDGSTIWTEASISVVFDEQGNFMCFLGVSRDINARKTVEDQLKIKEAAIQSSISAIALIDMNGIVLYVNNAGINLLGYIDDKEIIGKYFVNFSGNPELSEQIIDIIKVGKSVNREGSVKRKDGKILNVELWVNPVYNEQKVATNFMISFIDITERKIAEQKLIKSNEKLELMIKSGSVGLWDWNYQTGEYILSEQGLGLLGYSKGEVPEDITFWQRLNEQDDKSGSIGSFNKNFRKEDSSYFDERRMKHKEGHWVWIQSKGKVMEWDENGAPLRLMGTYIDITERKNAEIFNKMNADRVEAQYRMSLLEDKTEYEIITMALEEAVALTKSAAGFFHCLDDDQVNLRTIGWLSTTLANCVIPDITHYPVTEAGIWSECIKTQKPFVCNDYQQAEKKKGLPEGHFTLKRFISVPVLEGKKVRLVMGIGNKQEPYDDIDASQLTIFLEEVWKILQRSRLNEELRVTKEKAEESSKIKSSLLLNMSHELRTPLNGILGFGELLKDTVTDNEAKSMVDYINISGKRLMVTLTSIMELSQIESDKKIINISKVNLSELTQKTINKFADILEFKKLNLSNMIEGNIYIHTDLAMVSNMFYYIIDNAIKFTNAGQIWVILKSTIIDGEEYATFRVKDTGIGITEEQLKYIFEPFRQGSEGIGRSYEGNGLGLTLCKKFANMLGVRIEVESRPDLGSTFTIYFKIINEGANTGTEKPENTISIQEKKASSKPLVLVVEDNETNVELINLYLADRFNVESAFTGEMAIKLATLNKYDLILMDINLGSDMDGIEVTQEIRKMEKYSEVPVIAVTGYATDQERKAILEKGLTEYIAKPFSKDDLDKLIDVVLQKF